MNELYNDEAMKFIAENCMELASDDSSWEVLYKHISSEEFWVRSHPASEGNGGGGLLLSKKTEKEVRSKFKF